MHHGVYRSITVLVSAPSKLGLGRFEQEHGPQHVAGYIAPLAFDLVVQHRTPQIKSKRDSGEGLENACTCHALHFHISPNKTFIENPGLRRATSARKVCLH